MLANDEIRESRRRAAFRLGSALAALAVAHRSIVRRADQHVLVHRCPVATQIRSDRYGHSRDATRARPVRL